jgi:hypothetical protein
MAPLRVRPQASIKGTLGTGILAYHDGGRAYFHLTVREGGCRTVTFADSGSRLQESCSASLHFAVMSVSVANKRLCLLDGCFSTSVENIVRAAVLVDAVNGLRMHGVVSLRPRETRQRISTRTPSAV